jgi:hypothetical protein
VPDHIQAEMRPSSTARFKATRHQRSLGALTAPAFRIGSLREPRQLQRCLERPLAPDRSPTLWMQQNHSRRRRGGGERVLGLRRHEAREASGLASDRGKVCPVGEQMQQRPQLHPLDHHVLRAWFYPAPEPVVRTGLTAGGSRIRTSGPSINPARPVLTPDAMRGIFVMFVFDAHLA